MDTILNQDISRIEELSFNAHPALNTYFYDGWYMRFANGYTNRANSVNMLHPSTISIERKIERCEEIYATKGQPAIFKVTPLSAEIDSLLVERGYSLVTPTNIMLMDITNITTKKLTAEVTVGINKGWQRDFFRLTGQDEQIQSTAEKMHENIINTALCATVSAGGEAVACGLGIVENEYVGLYDIEVSEKHRRQGIGSDICMSLLLDAAKHGATRAYLQVVDSNDKAKRLYEKLGFRFLYQYWYRRQG